MFQLHRGSVLRVSLSEMAFRGCVYVMSGGVCVRACALVQGASSAALPKKNLRQTPKVCEREMEETKHKTFNAFPHEGGENMLFYMCCISEVRVGKEEQSIRVLKKVMFYAV